MEAWTEVNLVSARALDAALLLDVVDPIVHGELSDEIETWFYVREQHGYAVTVTNGYVTDVVDQGFSR